MTDSMLSGHSYGAPPPTAFTTASPTISTDTGPSNTFASHGHMNGGQERDMDSRHYPHREEPSISRLPSTQSPYVTLLQKNRGKLLEVFFGNYIYFISQSFPSLVMFWGFFSIPLHKFFCFEFWNQIFSSHIFTTKSFTFCGYRQVWVPDAITVAVSFQLNVWG